MLITAAFLVFMLLAVNGEGEVKNVKEPGELCPLGWEKFESQCYKFFIKKTRWTDAEKQCHTSKGHLASVHKPGVNVFLKTFVQKQAPQINNIWIGGYYATQKAGWIWSDGSNFDYSNWNTKPVVKGKKCVLAATKGEPKWRDALCFIHHSFVCYKMAVKAKII